jgi:Flp pilus assembly protein TadG
MLRTSSLRFLPSRFLEGHAAAKFGQLKWEEGANLVEYGLSFLLFMTMLLGIVDFGRALYAYHFVSHAAKQATRWAAVNGSTCSNDSSCNGTNGMNSGAASASDVQTYVSNNVPLGIDSSQITTTASWPVQTGSPTVCSTTKNYPGCTVQVQVSYNFSFLFPFVQSSPWSLSSTSQMVVIH